MPTANSIITPQTPISYTGIATTAETTFNNPTNAAVVIPVADNTTGMRLTKVFAINRAAWGGATNVSLYKLVGSTYTLIDSVLAGDSTPAAAVASTKGDFGISEDNPLILQIGEGLAFSVGRSVANGVVCRAEGGKY
jgi:hypothetical protein